MRVPAERPSDSDRNSILSPWKVPLRTIVAASRPRWVSGKGASILTSFPTTSGTNLMIGAARLCCSFRTIPPSGPMQRSGLKPLGTVKRLFAIGKQDADDPPRRLPRLVRSVFDSAAQFVHGHFLEYQRPTA